jgi:hypothetical protein
MCGMLLGLFARKTFDLTASETELLAAVASRSAYSRMSITVPVDHLVMHRVFRYSGGWHPFVAALRDGPEVLDGFYRRVRPKNFAEYYRIDGGADLPPWALPWIGFRPPKAEHGLGLEHGISYYGPASPEKVALENARLLDIAERSKVPFRDLRAAAERLHAAAHALFRQRRSALPSGKDAMNEAPAGCGAAVR